MRDAFGGTFMIEILMVFVVLFVSFTAVMVNVAKTFRIKNQIINIVEQTQYTPNNKRSIDAINNYMRGVGYQKVTKQSCSGYWDNDYGYCIESIDNNNYYKVTVYVSISLPFMGFQLNLPISGESKSYANLS